MEFNKIVTLGELSIEGKGSYGIGASSVDFKENLPTYLRITDISEDGYLLKNSLKSVDDPNANKYLLKPNDIVFARTGNSTGKSYFYDGTDGELVYAGFLIKFSLDVTKVNPEFIRYYTLSNQYKGWIKGFSTGSTRGNINANSYANMPINLPPREYQDFIVSILSGLENKYILNNSIILNLEQLSQTLFNRWFRDFEFPNEDGKSYKSSGGEMIESSMGLIPKGWKVQEIGDVIELSYGKALKKENRIPGRYPVYGSNGIVDYHNEPLVAGPGIIVGRKGTVGTVNLEHDNFFPIDTAFYITRKNKDINWNYLFLLLTSQNFAELSGDSAVPGLNRKHAYKNKFILPSISVVRKFEKILDSIFMEIYNLKKEKENLTNIRDTLLPKFLAGDIEIPDETEVTDHVSIP